MLATGYMICGSTIFSEAFGIPHVVLAFSGGISCLIGHHARTLNMYLKPKILRLLVNQRRINPGHVVVIRATTSEVELCYRDSNGGAVTYSTAKATTSTWPGQNYMAGIATTSLCIRILHITFVTEDQLQSSSKARE